MQTHNFDILVGTNLTGVGKMIFMLHDHFDDQEYSMFMSGHSSFRSQCRN